MINVGTMAQQTAARARDPNMTGTTQLQVIDLLSYSQQVVNGILGDVVELATLNLVAGQLLYPISTYLPNAIRILAVRDASGRDLPLMGPFESLVWSNSRWPAAVTDYPRGFVICGRDILVIYPAPKVAQSVTVAYSKLTTVLGSPLQTTEVPNETDDAVMDLGELLLLIKARDFDPFKDALQRFTQRLLTIKSEVR